MSFDLAVGRLTDYPHQSFPQNVNSIVLSDSKFVNKRDVCPVLKLYRSSRSSSSVILFSFL